MIELRSVGSMTESEDSIPGMVTGALATPETAESPDEVLKKLFGVYSQLMGMTDLSADDDFFEIGGTSVLAIQIKARADEMFGAEIPLSAFFEVSTPREMAALIREMSAGSATPPGDA